jgi:outer membrane receptor for monomeric catechols
MLRATPGCNDAITIRDQFRYGSYAREFRITEPGVSGVIAPGTPLASITATRTMQGLRSSETFLDNQTEALLKFDAWEFQHRAVIGLEAGRQTRLQIRSSRHKLWKRMRSPKARRDLRSRYERPVKIVRSQRSRRPGVSCGEFCLAAGE